MSKINTEVERDLLKNISFLNPFTLSSLQKEETDKNLAISSEEAPPTIKAIAEELNEFEEPIAEAAYAAIAQHLKEQIGLLPTEDRPAIQPVAKTRTDSQPSKEVLEKIDSLSQEIHQFLSDHSSPFTDNSPQLIPFDLKKLEQMNEKEMTEVLSTACKNLSLYYLEHTRLAESHSFDVLSQKIGKINKKQLPSLVSQINDLLKLNQVAWLLKHLLINLLNYLHSISGKVFHAIQSDTQKLVQKFKPLLQAIEKIREDQVKKFALYIDKPIEGEILQTLQSLSLSELNLLEKSLNLTTDELDQLKESHAVGEMTPPAPLPPSTPSLPSLAGKKVVIFTCSFGTGHKTTAQAIKQTLEQAQAKASIHDLTTGALLGKDRYRKIFKALGINYNNHPLNGVDIFNEILKRQWYVLINTKNRVESLARCFLGYIGITLNKDGVSPAIGLSKNNWEKTQIRDILLSERPDQIVTTYHMDNNPILEVAQELGIPVLHVPTDFDMKSWEVFNQTTPNNLHFKTLIPNQDVAETLQTAPPLSKNQLVEGVGIPLRLEFYNFLSEGEKKAYRLERGIKEGEKVLCLSAGGNGQHLPHPEQLANSPTWKTPLRIEVIAGRNRDFVAHLQKKLKAVNGNPLLLQGTNPHVTIEIVANLDPAKKGAEDEFFISAAELSKILDITDGCLAKAGGVSVAELLFKGVPILFDQRVEPFAWELFNIGVAVKHGMGLSHFNIKSFEKDLSALLEIPRGNNSSFYFKNSREILCQTIRDQIQVAENDPLLADKRRDLVADAKFHATLQTSSAYEHLTTAVKEWLNQPPVPFHDLSSRHFTQL